VELLHANLMNSLGHKANILNGTFREIGIGFDTGPYQTWDGAFVTQNFARSGGTVFLTGVGMDDKDGDRSYDIGEGLGGLTVTAVSSSGARYSTTTEGAGGYSLALAAGTYSVTFSGSGYAPVTKQVTIASSNVKLDLIDPATGASPTPTSPTISGTAGNNTLKGTSAANTIKGNGGNDKLYAGTGTMRSPAMPATTGSTATAARTPCPAAAATTSSPEARMRTRSASRASGARTRSPTFRTPATTSICAATA
jgi:hypothetical protein